MIIKNKTQFSKVLTLETPLCQGMSGFVVLVDLGAGLGVHLKIDKFVY